MLKLTPPMGWNSWNTFAQNINAQLIMEMADYMAAEGYLEKGYEYLVIDDCWSLRDRDENGRLVPDPEKFPHGMGLNGVSLHFVISQSYYLTEDARTSLNMLCKRMDNHCSRIPDIFL